MRPSEMAYLLALLLERPPEGLGPFESFRLKWSGEGDEGFQVQLNTDLFLVRYDTPKTRPRDPMIPKEGRFEVYAVSEDLPYRSERSGLLQAHLTVLRDLVEFVRANAAGPCLIVRERAVP